MKPVIDLRQQEADRLIRPIREGKPELGWSGDQTLALAFHRIENRWELWRHEPVPGEPERHIMVARGPVGQDINEDAINMLIMHLVQMDTHRSGNSAEEIVERTIKANDAADRAATAKAADGIADPLAKFYHEAGKTFGVTRTEFYT